MFACSYCSWNWFEIEFELNTLGLWFLKIELWTVLFYMFTSVFWKFSPRGSVLMLLNLGFGLEVQSGIPRFCTSARAGEVPLERGIRASSISVLFYSQLERRIGRSSGVMCLKLERASSVRRAEISSIQYFYSTLERESWRSSVYLYSMSARAGKPELERESIFLKNPILFSDHIFASSSHSRHS